MGATRPTPTRDRQAVASAGGGLEIAKTVPITGCTPLVMTPNTTRALGAALLLVPGVLSAATVEERLAEMEARLGALSSENAALRQQLDAVAKKQAESPVTPAGKVKKLSIGGYIQVQGETGDAPDSRFPVNDRFLVRRARLTVKGSFAEDIDFTFQSEFGNGNMSANTAYRAQLTDLFVRWKKFDFAAVQVGQFKTPFGYEQLLPDTKNPFVERSLPNDRLTLGRQIGAMVSGDFLDQRLSYSVGAFSGNGVNNGGNDNENFLTVGRVAGVPVKTKAVTITAGANAFTSDDGLGAAAVQRDGYGLDLQFKAGRFDGGAEWLCVDANPAAGVDTTADGWSAHVGYMILAEKLRAGLRYETYDPDTDTADDESKSWTLGLTYFLKGDDLKFSLNYVLGDPAGALSDQGRLLAQAQVIF